SDVCSYDLLPAVAIKALLDRSERRIAFRTDGVATDRIAVVVGAPGRELRRALRRIAAEIFGQPVGRVAEIGERGERRPADAEHRTEIEEDRRTQAHFLGAGAQRNVDLEPPLVIGAAAQRVV